jgi:hypothetical protein
VKQYKGNLDMVAQSYFGFGKDETGNTNMTYRDKVMAEYNRLKGTKSETTQLATSPSENIQQGAGVSDFSVPPSLDEIAPYHAADASADDLFGYTPEVAAMPELGPRPGSWMDAVAANREQYPCAMPSPNMAEITPNMQMDDYLNMLVNEEFDGREFANA